MALTITWNLPRSTYTNLRLEIISDTEGIRLEPYRDSVGIPTIGIGYNLRDSGVLQSVLNVIFGSDGNNSLEQGYRNNVRAAVALSYGSDAALRSALNAIMQTRLNDRRLNGLNRRATFAFSNSSEASTPYNTVVSTYENRVTNWLTSIPESQERAALVSLSYNGGLGRGLRTAILNNNRAEAWYEIRYRTNGGRSESAGIAKRRYYESAVFGLFNNSGNVGEEEAKNAYRTYTRHFDRIKDYERQYETQINNANRDYQTSIVRTLRDEFSPAYRVLVDKYAAKQKIDEILVDFEPKPENGTQEVNDSIGVYDPNTKSLKGTNSNDLIFGEEGNDFIQSGSGDDILIGYSGTQVIGTFERDTLTGGTGADVFVLGDKDRRFYSEGGKQGVEIEPINTENGRAIFLPEGLKPKDFALITDFNPNEGDKLQLKGPSFSSDGIPAYRAIGVKNKNFLEFVRNTPLASQLNQDLYSTALVHSKGFNTTAVDIREDDIIAIFPGNSRNVLSGGGATGLDLSSGSKNVVYV